MKKSRLSTCIFIAFLSKILIAVGLICKILTPDVAFAQAATRRAVELESFSARDLSLSLLRDNYDAWAEETTKKYATELAKRLSDKDLVIDDLLQREAEISDQIRKKLYNLAFSSSVDASALKAALFIASRTQGRERSQALQRATVLSQQISPASAQTLEVAVMYTADLLASGDLPQANRMSAKIVTMASQAQLVDTVPACLAKVVAGDVSFQEREFSNAADLYVLARECFAAHSSGNAFQGLQLDLRLAWTSFRLTRYADVLRHLEGVTRDPSSLKLSANPAVMADLAVMLGVALSEVEVPLPASRWPRLSVQFPWVASGLAKAIRFLSQKDSDNLSLRWADAIEQNLIGTPAAEDFYLAAADSAGKSGMLERQIEFKERGVLALQISGHYARSLSKDLRREQQRAARVISWAKEVISFRAGQFTSNMPAHKALQFFRVAEALSSENIELCASSETFGMAHRALTASKYLEYSEKIYSLLRDCRIAKPKMEDVRSARLEMFQLLWKDNTKDLIWWQRFRDEVFDALAFAPEHPEVRRISFDALNDALEFTFLVDGEDLLKRLYASHQAKDEGTHFERTTFVSAAVRLLSFQHGRPSLESLSWLMHRDIAINLGVTDPTRRLFEGALAAFIVEHSMVLKREGRLMAAAERLLEAGEKMGRDSEFARDLVFFAARSFCGSGFQVKCLETSASIAGSSIHSEHDRFFAHRWLGGVYLSQGRFVSAANAWVNSAELARALGRQELLNHSVSDLTRSGNIFSELKLWQEALKVKELLLDIADASKQLAMAYRSVLDWSVAALREEAYDHADLLSEGLTSLAQQRRKELASLSGTALSFAGVVEDYAKLRARKLPAVQIENRIVNFVSERKSQFSPETVREILPVGSVAVTRSIFEFWRNELEKEAERSIVGQSLADLNRNAQRLGMLFASLMRGCTVLAKQPKFLPDINRNCAGELSARFVDHNARIISGLSRLADSTSAEFKNIYMMVQIQGDEFRRGSLRGPRSVVPQADPGFAILENRSTPSIEREVSR